MLDNDKTPLYDKLKSQKDNGENIILQDIAYETMRELWWKESVSDNMIAELFNTTVNKVRNHRNKLKVKLQIMSAVDYMEQVKILMKEKGVFVEYSLL